MKIYNIRPDQNLLGDMDYLASYECKPGETMPPWRLMHEKIRGLDPLDPPSNMIFSTYLKMIPKADWLINDFGCPIISRELINTFKHVGEFKHATYPVTLIDDTYPEPRFEGQTLKQDIKTNVNYSALHILEEIDCIDRVASKPRITTLRTGETRTTFDFQEIVFKDGLQFPPIFKIKNISTPLALYGTEETLAACKVLNIKGIVFMDQKGNSIVLA